MEECIICFESTELVQSVMCDKCNQIICKQCITKWQNTGAVLCPHCCTHFYTKKMVRLQQLIALATEHNVTKKTDQFMCFVDGHIPSPLYKLIISNPAIATYMLNYVNNIHTTIMNYTPTMQPCITRNKLQIDDTIYTIVTFNGIVLNQLGILCILAYHAIEDKSCVFYTTMFRPEVLNKLIDVTYVMCTLDSTTFTGSIENLTRTIRNLTYYCVPLQLVLFKHPKFVSLIRHFIDKFTLTAMYLLLNASNELSDEVVPEFTQFTIDNYDFIKQSFEYLYKVKQSRLTNDDINFLVMTIYSLLTYSCKQVQEYIMSHEMVMDLFNFKKDLNPKTAVKLALIVAQTINYKPHDDYSNPVIIGTLMNHLSEPIVAKSVLNLWNNSTIRERVNAVNIVAEYNRNPSPELAALIVLTTTPSKENIVDIFNDAARYTGNVKIMEQVFIIMFKYFNKLTLKEKKTIRPQLQPSCEHEHICKSAYFYRVLIS